jgi:hypothetical protein
MRLTQPFACAIFGVRNFRSALQPKSQKVCQQGPVHHVVSDDGDRFAFVRIAEPLNDRHRPPQDATVRFAPQIRSFGGVFDKAAVFLGIPLTDRLPVEPFPEPHVALVQILDKVRRRILQERDGLGRLPGTEQVTAVDPRNRELRQEGGDFAGLDLARGTQGEIDRVSLQRVWHALIGCRGAVPHEIEPRDVAFR